jgi:ABC-type antimicrobial peptide transport system permease subunit
VMTMARIIDERLGKESALTNIIGVFGLTALILAGLGIYAVTAYSVRQRTREIGIRLALGARRGNILALIVRQSLVYILIGVAAGVFTAVALSRTIASLLYGVEPMDGATFAVSALVLIGVGAAASFIPARRASLVDPVVALRQE